MKAEQQHKLISQRVWRLGKAAGVPIESDMSSLLLTIFVFLFIKSAVLYTYPEWSEWVAFPLTLLISLFLIVSVIAHELGHSVVAVKLGVEVRRITISPLGGVSHIPQEPDTPRKEALIALAGPLVSLGLAGICGLGWLLVPVNQSLQSVSFLLLSATAINFMVAAFNLLPGLPLDGGRALRATIWAITHDYDRATRLTSYFGMAIGSIMVIGSIWFLSVGAYFVAAILNGTGLFVIISATLGSRYNRWQSRLRAVSVAGLVRQDFGMAEAALPLGELLSQQLLQRPFVVLIDKGQVAGAITLTDAKKVASDLWWHVPSSSVMTPFHQLTKLYPYTNALQATSLMQQHKTSMALVMANPTTPDLKDLLGVVAQHHLHAVARSK